MYTIELSEKQMGMLIRALCDGEWNTEKIRKEIQRQKLNQDEDARREADYEERHENEILTIRR